MTKLEKTIAPSTESIVPIEDIVAKLWHLCNILREAGITYPEYVTELTYLLFLRMADETGSEVQLPKGFRWHDLATKEPKEQFTFYKQLLRRLGRGTKGPVREIFTDAETCLSGPKHLSLLVAEFGKIDWYAAREESALADVYEGLLDKNSSESKAGAGQYFTPRPLVDCMVALVKPKPGEVVQDPACGTAGFLIAASRYVRNQSALSPKQNAFQQKRAFIGVELVTKTHRLALMNAMLHDIRGGILLGDSLSELGSSLPASDVILTNPPFGTKKGSGLPSRIDLKWRTSNKQLCFLQHIYMNLKSGGRAAVVMPDLQGTVAAEVCAELMDQCRLHTILRLPVGIFYAPGIKTNVFFFNRCRSKKDKTKDVWVYDLRSNMPSFGKRTPFTSAHLAEFEAAFGGDPDGNSAREVTERFRRFTREEVRKRGDTLDLSWHIDESAMNYTKLPPPTELLAGVLANLNDAMKHMRTLERNLVR